MLLFLDKVHEVLELQCKTGDKDNLVMVSVVICAAVLLSIIMGVLIWLIKVLCVCLSVFVCLLLIDYILSSGLNHKSKLCCFFQRGWF